MLFVELFCQVNKQQLGIKLDNVIYWVVAGVGIVITFCILFRMRRSRASAERTASLSLLAMTGTSSEVRLLVENWDPESESLLQLYTIIMRLLSRGDVRMPPATIESFHESGSKYFEATEDLTPDVSVGIQEQRAVSQSIMEIQSDLRKLDSLTEEERILKLACKKLIGQLAENVEPIR